MFCKHMAPEFEFADNGIAIALKQILSMIIIGLN